MLPPSQAIVPLLFSEEKPYFKPYFQPLRAAENRAGLAKQIGFEIVVRFAPSHRKAAAGALPRGVIRANAPRPATPACLISDNIPFPRIPDGSVPNRKSILSLFFRPSSWPTRVFSTL